MTETVFDRTAKIDEDPITRGMWTEATKKDYFYALEVLPPIVWRGDCFMLGECTKHDSRGACYEAFIKIGARYFAKIAGINTFDPIIYENEVRIQFKINHKRTVKNG